MRKLKIPVTNKYKSRDMKIAADIVSGLSPFSKSFRDKRLRNALNSIRISKKEPYKKDNSVFDKAVIAIPSSSITKADIFWAKEYGLGEKQLLSQERGLVCIFNMEKSNATICAEVSQILNKIRCDDKREMPVSKIEPKIDDEAYWIVYALYTFKKMSFLNIARQVYGMKGPSKKSGQPDQIYDHVKSAYNYARGIISLVKKYNGIKYVQT